jgi:hypothetical protein
VREITLATAAGAASSSCSYASAAVSRTLFKKGGCADPEPRLHVRIDQPGG